MLLLPLSAPAAALDVPLRATFSEYTAIGEDPSVVDDVLSATVDVSNADTGKTFSTTGELLLREKTGAGVGELTFDGDPSGSVRTWALYLLDANGAALAKEPEIVVLSFGHDGMGAIAARTGGPIVIKAVRIKKRGVGRVANSDDGTHQVRVTVQGDGTKAAYVGIQELGADGDPLAVHADMASMTADAYASFQALALDGLVALDTWSAELAGTVAVDGLSIAGATVEGGAAIQYDLAFGGAACDPTGKAACPTLPSATYVGAPLAARTKGASVRADRVSLQPEDEVFDEYDAAMDFVVDGDGRGFELLAVLTPEGEGPAPLLGEWITLSPDDLAVGATATAAGVFPKAPEAEGVLTAAIQAIGGEGQDRNYPRPWLDCNLTPTARSATASSTKLQWIGECVQDDDGQALVRAFQMTMDADGAVSLRAELLGAEWQDATALAFDIAGEHLGIGYLEGAAAVVSTTFRVGWSFDQDVDGQAYSLAVAMQGPTAPVDFTIEQGGWYTWTPEDGEEPQYTYTPDDQSRCWCTSPVPMGSLLSGLAKAGARR